MIEQPKSTLPKRPISDFHLFRTWNLFNMVGGVIGQIYAPTKEEAFEWARERWGKLLYSVDLERRPEETWAPIYWS